jgi:ubiquinone/menaquinone biosynthesis C-methylase UbiE
MIENQPVDGVQSFYDSLAADYSLLFADWRASVQRHGDVLAALIRQYNADAHAVLDATCGIGTQAIGLALRLDVTASDLSPAAVEGARREAESFGAAIRFGVADLRRWRIRSPDV